jgi:hypothetical protein
VTEHSLEETYENDLEGNKPFVYGRNNSEIKNGAPYFHSLLALSKKKTNKFLILKKDVFCTVLSTLRW